MVVKAVRVRKFKFPAVVIFCSPGIIRLFTADIYILQ